MTDQEAQGLGFSVAGYMPLDEWNKRFLAIMGRLYGRSKADSMVDVTELLKLHNDKFRPTYALSGCSSCALTSQKKAFAVLSKHYEKMNENK